MRPCLRRNRNVTLSCKCSARGSRAAAGANRGALSAALDGLFELRRLNRVRLSVHRERIERQRQQAPPLTRPACTTVPFARVPVDRTVTPSTLIGAASDAANGLPLLFVFELTVWSIVTVRRVPAGITMGGGAGGGSRWLWELFAAGAPAN